MEKTSVTYSVVIVTYFHDKYIEKALESVLRQSEIDKAEILIGDDGSKDGTLQILHEYEEKFPNIHVYAHENMGLSKNLYQLLKSARGEYIAILEGDDYWLDDNKLRKQREIIDKNNCLGTACNSLIIDNDGNEKGLWNSVLKNGLVSDKDILFHQTAVCHPSAVMLKNIFKDSGDKYEVIEKASRMGGNHTGMINLIANEGGLYLDTTPMVVWRHIQVEGGTNYSSHKYDKPLNCYEAMQKYEMYDRVFRLDYSQHIYEEYHALKKALRNEFIESVGCSRFRKAKYKYFIYRVRVAVKRKITDRIKRIIKRGLTRKGKNQ